MTIFPFRLLASGQSRGSVHICLTRLSNFCRGLGQAFSWLTLLHNRKASRLQSILTSGVAQGSSLDPQKLGDSLTTSYFRVRVLYHGHPCWRPSLPAVIYAVRVSIVASYVAGRALAKFLQANPPMPPWNTHKHTYGDDPNIVR